VRPNRLSCSRKLDSIEMTGLILNLLHWYAGFVQLPTAAVWKRAYVRSAAPRQFPLERFHSGSTHSKAASRYCLDIPAVHGKLEGAVDPGARGARATREIQSTQLHNAILGKRWWTEWALGQWMRKGMVLWKRAVRTRRVAWFSRSVL
jgi:hypothetical protein